MNHELIKHFCPVAQCDHNGSHSEIIITIYSYLTAALSTRAKFQRHLNLNRAFLFCQFSPSGLTKIQPSHLDKLRSE